MDKSVASLWRVVASFALFSILTVVAISCSTDDGVGDSTKSEPLVVYSGRSESLIAPLIADFEEITGEEVLVNYGSSLSIQPVL